MQNRHAAVQHHKRRTVFQRDGGGGRLLCNAVKSGPEWLIIVRTKGIGNQAKPVHPCKRVSTMANLICHTMGEPAQRAGAKSAEHYAARPCFPEYIVHVECVP